MNKYNITWPLSIALRGAGADLRNGGGVIYVRRMRAYDAKRRTLDRARKMRRFWLYATNDAAAAAAAARDVSRPVDGRATLASAVLENTCWSCFSPRVSKRAPANDRGDFMHLGCTVQQQCSVGNRRLPGPTTETDAVAGRRIITQPLHPRCRQSSWVVASVPVCPHRCRLVKMRFAAQRWHFRTYGWCDGRWRGG
jgi:hypothetical protein